MRKPFRYIIIKSDSIHGSHNLETCQDCALDFDTCFIDLQTQTLISVDGEQPLTEYKE